MELSAEVDLSSLGLRFGFQLDEAFGRQPFFLFYFRFVGLCSRGSFLEVPTEVHLGASAVDGWLTRSYTRRAKAAPLWLIPFAIVTTTAWRGFSFLQPLAEVDLGWLGSLSHLEGFFKILFFLLQLFLSPCLSVFFLPPPFFLQSFQVEPCCSLAPNVIK